MLEKLTDTSIEAQRKWLKFIIERVGHNNLPRVFDYYKSIGWISVPVAERLLALAQHEKRYNGTSWTLSAEEHRISRLYIEKLMGRRIDDALLSVSEPGRARPESTKKVKIRPGYNLHPIHPVEKKKMEFMIHRREVTISNLEEELEDRDAEICELKERIRELEVEIDECQKEMKRNRIYMDILDQNIRLRKVDLQDGPKRFGKK